MEPEQTRVIKDCARGSLAGELTFPEVVSRLVAIGLERYHADYSRQEITYYTPDGESLVVPAPHAQQPVGGEFSATAVAGAVAQSQRSEHTYADFVRKTIAAGCVGYFVQLTGRRVLYFGRNGDCHIEYFPSP